MKQGLPEITKRPKAPSMKKPRGTFLSKADVERAYMTSMLMSSQSQAIEVLFRELTEIILFNKEQEREADVERWIAREKKERQEDRKRAREHKDDEDSWSYVSVPPHAMTYRGVTICGWCLQRDGEPKPKDGCYRHYWDKENRPRK